MECRLLIPFYLALTRQAPPRWAPREETDPGNFAGASILAVRSHFRTSIRNHKLDVNGSVRWNGNLLRPFHRVGEHWPLDPHLGHDVIDCALSGNLPAFVPRFDFIFAGRNVGQPEVSIFV